MKRLIIFRLKLGLLQYSQIIYAWVSDSLSHKLAKWANVWSYKLTNWKKFAFIFVPRNNVIDQLLLLL